MRIVMLCSSVYSETSCAMAIRLAQTGFVPVGAIALPSLDHATLLRKLAQWGALGVARYAWTKSGRNAEHLQLRNLYLQPILSRESGVFRSLREVAAFYEFPIAVFRDQNAPNSIAQVREWSPDLIVFSGGNILRPRLLEIPRLGVLNLHLGLLPETRGMSSPEWSLLTGIPIGVTIHYIDAGIDTGPILRRCEFPEAFRCESLDDLRNRMIAFGIEKIIDVVADLGRDAIKATPQSELDQDNQHFVMHEWLQAQASERLKKIHPATLAMRSHG
jgi:methionyl-tRNA formyltransferase